MSFLMNLVSHINIALCSLWKAYVNVRDAPSSLGKTFYHKFFVLSLYAGGIGMAAYMTIDTLSHQPVFISVERNEEGTMLEVPSFIFCQDKVPGYNYGFFSKFDKGTGLRREEELRLSKGFVNFLAERSFKGELDSFETETEFGKEYINELRNFTHPKGLKITPKFVWEHIIVNDDPSLDVNCGQKDIRGYNQEDNLDMHSSVYYCRRDVRLIWLSNGLYCFFWNRTGLLFKFDKLQTRNRLVPVFDSPPRYVWVGNLLTEPINLMMQGDNSTHVEIIIYSISVYYVGNREKERVCQPLLGEKCHTKTRQILSGYWQYATYFSSDSTAFLSSRIDRHDDVEININQGVGWINITETQRFTIIKAGETIGTMFGIWVGLSLFSLIKTMLALLKISWLKGMKNWVFLLIQACFIVLLLVGTGFLQYLDLENLAKNRFITEFDVVLSKGVPFEEFSICPRLLTRYNHTVIRKYKISHPLLIYIQSTAILERPANYIPKSSKPFFLWDKETPQEIGFHWNFMEFPIQYFGNNSYERHMKKIESEYENLAHEFGVSSEKPSWSLMEKIMLDPCKIIKHCFINGDKVKPCCQHFSYSLMKWSYVRICWKFQNIKKLTQTRPGEDNGITVVMDPMEWNHTMPHYYIDEFMQDYVEKNCSARNCSMEYPYERKYGGWNPQNAIQLFSNKGNTQISFAYVRLANSKRKTPMGEVRAARTTTVTEIRRYTESSKLEYREKNNCSNTNHPNDKFLYLQREIIKEWCNCSACVPFPVYKGQNENCCTPRQLGRCLTEQRMHTPLCHRNGKTNQRQFQYAGNLPSEAPVNVFLNRMRQCDFDTLFRNSTSPFYEVYKTLEKNMDSVFKENCVTKVVDVKWETVYDKTVYPMYKNKISEYMTNFQNGKFEMKMKFFHKLLQYTIFREKDLQNVFEIFSLLFGVLGLLLGFTYIVIFELTWVAVSKLYLLHCGSKKDETDQSSVSDEVVVLSLGKFMNRIQSIRKKKDAVTPHCQKPVAENVDVSHTSKVIQVKPSKAQNIVEETKQADAIELLKSSVQNSDEPHASNSAAGPSKKQSINEHNNVPQETAENFNDPNTSKVKQVKPSKAQNIMEETKQVDAIVPLEDQKSSVENSEQPHAPNSAPGPSKKQSINEHTGNNVTQDNQDSESKHKNIFFSIMLVIGFCIMVTFIWNLYESMKHDSVINYVDFEYSNIIGPVTGACQVSRSANSQVELASGMVECLVENKGIDCGQIFETFLHTSKYYCLLSSNHLVNGTPISRVKVRFNQNFEIWMGNIESLREGFVEVNAKLQRNHILHSLYHQWQIKDEAICANPNMPYKTCSLCNQDDQNQISDGFCCFRPGIKVPHFGRGTPRMSKCNESFYSFSYRKKPNRHCYYADTLLTGKQPVEVNYTKNGCEPALDVRPMVEMKRTVNRLARRSKSEQFLLYAGYIDMFIGLNIDNVVYSITFGLLTPLYVLLKRRLKISGSVSNDQIGN